MPNRDHDLRGMSACRPSLRRLCCHRFSASQSGGGIWCDLFVQSTLIDSLVTNCLARGFEATVRASCIQLAERSARRICSENDSFDLMVTSFQTHILDEYLLSLCARKKS
eukprot:6213311-Pleurochrysis_carterae.AAC.8